MCLESFLNNINLSDHITIKEVENITTTDIRIAADNAVPPDFGNRQLTPARYAMAKIFANPDPVATAKLAQKIISEWNDHDRSPKMVFMRDKTLSSLNKYLASKGEKPVPAGKRGAWLSSPAQSEQAPNEERTILLALSAFQRMLSGRILFITRKA